MLHIRASAHHALLQMNPLSNSPFIFYVTALSFIGPPGQLDSSVSRTKETKWDRGRAVMSNSSYSVTYGAAAVWGSLLETMEGFERSESSEAPLWLSFLALGSSVGADCGVGAAGFFWVGEELGGEDPPLRWPFTDTGGVGVDEGLLVLVVVVVWKEGSSSRRGLLCGSVNAEVTFSNTRPRCLRPPARDFLTATLSLAKGTSC